MIALIKYILSFLKNDWNLDDYPVQVKKQNRNNSELRRGKLPVWIARINNWHQLIGFGETRKEALDMLKVRFEEYRLKNHKLPRPGVRVPIVFASDDGVRKHKLLARDFFRRILNRDFDKCFISDKSSIWDFPEADDQIYERIQQVYKVDVSDIKNGSFVEIFERISKPQLSDSDTLDRQQME